MTDTNPQGGVPVEDALALLAKFDSLTISERLGLPAQIMLSEVSARAAVAQAQAAVRSADALDRAALSLALLAAKRHDSPWPSAHRPRIEDPL